MNQYNCRDNHYPHLVQNTHNEENVLFFTAYTAVIKVLICKHTFLLISLTGIPQDWIQAFFWLRLRPLRPEKKTEDVKMKIGLRVNWNKTAILQLSSCKGSYLIKYLRCVFQSEGQHFFLTNEQLISSQ